MTREKAIEMVRTAFTIWESEYDTGEDWSEQHKARDAAINALKKEPCEDEIILTKEEYEQLLSNEFDNGYAKGYREALEQDSVLGKIKAEIEALPKTYPFVNHFDMYVKVSDVTKIIEKYKAESNG